MPAREGSGKAANELRQHFSIVPYRVRLPGAQKQQIAIARALLEGLKVLIFDEATNSLDTQACPNSSSPTVNRLKGRVTMVFITHQLPKELQVDNVFQLGAHPMEMGVVGEEKKDA